MARLTVSYSIAFIPGLPRPLALSEVIDDVVGLSTFTSGHTVRQTPGTPDRLDIIVPVGDLESALDSAARAADELTRIGESLLGLGFVVEERAIRIDGLSDNWLPETFDGAGTRHHASTHLDAAAPLPDHLEEPTGDVPDEDLRLDDLTRLPAADQPFRPFAAPGPDDPFAAPSDGEEPGGGEDREEPAPRGVERRFTSPRNAPAAASRGGGAGDDARRDDARPGLVLAPIGRTATLHREELAAVVRRRDLVRQLAVAPAPSPPDHRAATRTALALFAVALLAAIVPWRLHVSVPAIFALAFVAAGVVAGAATLWPRARGFTARTALPGAATLAVVLAFASAYAICAHEGDLHATRGGTGAPTTVGQALSAAVSLGAAPGLDLGPRARAVAYGERLVLLLTLAGLGAQMARTTRRRA
jgi:hypothetical protein